VRTEYNAEDVTVADGLVAVAAAAAAAAAAALSAGCGGRNFRMMSLGSFSRGSWCHLVGTGGGTVIDIVIGFSNNSVRLGFSEHKRLGTFEVGALSNGDDANLFVADLLGTFSLLCCSNWRIRTLDESVGEASDV
jgi:hypothetical protein